MTTSDIHTGPLPRAAEDGEHHAGPLPRAPEGDEHHVGPLPQAPTGDERIGGPPPTKEQRAQRAKKTWREQRWERRRRRRMTEEVLGWILVPVILVCGFWAVKGGLAAFGTTPTALFQGVKTALSASGRF